MELVHQSQLPFVGMSREFVGAKHGGFGISFFLVIGVPGRGPRLQKQLAWAQNCLAPSLYRCFSVCSHIS
jgi:hypothetical protein